jgi:hypothetical protein
VDFPPTLRRVNADRPPEWPKAIGEFGERRGE